MQTNNKRRVIAIVLTITTLLVLALLFPNRTASKAEVVKPTVESTKVATTTPIGPVLSHKQEVWRYVLEWCESKGNPLAINQVDRDGTPSYYSYQFKPGTFRGYGELYGVIPKGLSETELMEALKKYELQKEIVGYMILDPSINWLQQFPDCVRKHGLPPKE